MSRVEGNELPPAFVSLYDGRDLESKIGPTVLLLTMDPDGWPAVALLSAGEVLVRTAREVRLALWPKSHTTGNLTAAGRAVLMFVDEDAWYARIEARRGPDLELPGMKLAYFDTTVLEILRDHVGYASLGNGIRFTLHEPHLVTPSWQQAIDALRDAPGVDRHTVP